MIYKLTTKDCKVSDQTRKHIDVYLAKLTQALVNLDSDLVVLRLNIRKNVDRYYPPRVHRHPNKTYADLKTALANFEGAITFRLNKNRFYVHFKGQTVDECIILGFDRIFRKLEKYKDLHFSSQSEYPDRSSVREVAYG